MAVIYTYLIVTYPDAVAYVHRVAFVSIHGVRQRFKIHHLANNYLENTSKKKQDSVMHRAHVLNKEELNKR
eukprot:scaffold109803_cov32-Tisochrysis_lutea.AAC.2